MYIRALYTHGHPQHLLLLLTIDVVQVANTITHHLACLFTNEAALHAVNNIVSVINNRTVTNTKSPVWPTCNMTHTSVDAGARQE